MPIPTAEQTGPKPLTLPQASGIIGTVPQVAATHAGSDPAGHKRPTLMPSILLAIALSCVLFRSGTCPEFSPVRPPGLQILH